MSALSDAEHHLVAVNNEKRPTKTGAERALDIRATVPADWGNVTVAAWNGLTAAYCQQHGAGVIIRGVRNAIDAVRECQLAAMNETLGITTLFMPARPELATISSTAVRAAAADLPQEGPLVSTVGRDSPAHTHPPESAIR
ncbi:pantetheine-phosphate adenylyltransferase [Micromonospora sp. B11E3]|uniref:pantetheine-phosphate adenylyltransferase n=1 Tax=Micromonospora sp. B11E3 TaxID=3153562 RepID=UPI00325EF331